jgi:beta-1,4-N-acetylglucosaminyltransferase
MRVRRLDRADVLLACSSGGHLFQMLELRPAWQEFTHVWLTDDARDTRSLLRGEPVVFVHGPTHRDLSNGVHRVALAWIRNIILALRLMRRVRPRVVLTTGAGSTVPCAWVARLVGKKVVYVESVTRIEAPSVSCRLISPIANRTYVQWPELAERVPRARYVGSVFETP